MKKKGILAIILAALICLPCILILDAGPEAPNGVEKFGWTNAVGFVWLAFLAFGGFKLITPKWIQRELKAYMGDDE